MNILRDSLQNSLFKAVTRKIFQTKHLANNSRHGRWFSRIDDAAAQTVHDYNRTAVTGIRGAGD
jgi:hypothetical protein